MARRRSVPWNPAILEQRIARIFRLGQERPVQILNLVSKNSIEEGINSIVEVDEKTGQTNIKIPVASKETVSNVLQLLGKLFGGQ